MSGEGRIVAERYRIVRPLGEGAMGSVHEAVNLATGREVALKVPHPQLVADPSFRRRFLREVRAASRLRHPNVIDVLDIVEDADGSPVAVMELLQGHSLARLLAAHRRLGLAETAAIVTPALKALHEAHEASIVHRDLKPENVFVAKSPDGSIQPKLLDFGVAKVLDGVGEGAAAPATRTGAMIGTPYYMSPEQVAARKDIDRRADVWAAGVLVYECLAGTRPFHGETFLQVFDAIARSEPKSLAEAVPGLPAEVCDAVAGALVRDRDERARTLLPLIEALEPHARKPSGQLLEFEQLDPDSTPTVDVAPGADTPIAAGDAGESEGEGRSFGSFELRRLLGKGGMGEVWLAFDSMLERQVAVKVIADGRLDDRAEKRLIREARAASALDHPGIVTVYQLGRNEGRVFIAMEHVDGQSLGALSKEQGSLPPARTADLVEQIAGALDAAHQAGLIHRDIKPDNVVVRGDGRTKILDFGLVHAVQPTEDEGADAPGDAVDSSMDATSAGETQLVRIEGGVVAGTPLYMAPEQALGRSATPAADQYALAASAYELLTGEPLRRGRSVQALLTYPVEEGLERSAGAIPPEAIEVLRRALSESPGDRYPSVGEFAVALRRALAPSRSEAPTAPSSRATLRRFLPAVLALALGALALAAYFASGPSQPSEIVMGVVPGNRALFAQVYTPIADDLSETLDAPVRPVIAESYEDAVSGIVSGHYQLAFLPPSSYVEAKRQLPDLELLGGIGYGGDLPYQSLVVARRSDAFQGPESLRGRRVCFVDPRSTSGFRVPAALLDARGIDVEREFVGDHYEILRRVIAGTCDAGAVSSMQFADAPRQALATDELEVLLESEPLPPVAVAAHPSLDADLRARIRSGLSRAYEHAHERPGALSSEEFGEFVSITDDQYDLVRDLPGGVR
jgi:serine/threonine-protein kinase